MGNSGTDCLKMTITDALAEENARQFRQIGKSGLPYQASLFE